MKTGVDTKLMRLGETKKFKVAKNYEDVRSWTVLGANGGTIGKVFDLIVDKDRQYVRYLEVDAIAQFPDVENKHILIPIGLATIHGDNQILTVRELTIDKLRNYPAFTGDNLTRDHEYSIRDYLSKPTSRAELFSDKLSPERENLCKEENELISRLKEERDQAYLQRDQVVKELDRIRDEMRNIKGEDPSAEEDPFYKHWYFECDEFETGRKC